MVLQKRIIVGSSFFLSLSLHGRLGAFLSRWARICYLLPTLWSTHTYLSGCTERAKAGVIVCQCGVGAGGSSKLNSAFFPPTLRHILIFFFYTGVFDEHCDQFVWQEFFCLIDVMKNHLTPVYFTDIIVNHSGVSKQNFLFSFFHVYCRCTHSNVVCVSKSAYDLGKMLFVVEGIYVLPV